MSRLAALFGLALVALPASAQSPLRDERGSLAAGKKGLLDANQVGLTAFTYGLLGGVGQVRGNWPIGSNDVYLGDLLPVVVAEVVDDAGAVVRVVETTRGPGNRGIPADPQPPFTPWTWEAVPGYASERVRSDTGQPNDRGASALDPLSWPAFWPDRQGDAADPGWAGSWDGFWGKNVFVDGDEHYSHVADNNVRTAAYTPDPAAEARGGLGLVTRQRRIALRDAGFEDAILHIWDITNTSPRDLTRIATGFIAGTLAGGDGDSQDDLVAVDAARGMVYAYDFDNRGNQGQPVGYTGFVMLPTPGGDRDLGAAFHAVPANAFPLGQADRVWQTVLNGIDVADCTPGGGCDGDAFVSTAPFALPAFTETRFAFAVVFGSDLAAIQQKADDLRAFAAAGLRFDDTQIVVNSPPRDAQTGLYTYGWTASGAGARVRLDVTTDDGRTWRLLEANLPASGQRTFAPGSVSQGIARVRATAFSATAVSRASTRDFTTPGSSAVTVRVSAPRGTVSGIVGVPYEAVSGQSSPGTVSLYDVPPAGSPVLLATDLPRSGVFQWDTRLAPNGLHRLRIEADVSGDVTAIRSEPFTVANARPELLTPGTYAGRGDGSVEPRAAIPEALTGHTYRVDFAGDRERAATYTVTDETTGQAVLTAPIPTAHVEGDLFDGLRLVVQNPETRVDQDASGWTVGDGQVPLALSVAQSVSIGLQGRTRAYDYTIAFSDAPVTEALGGIRIGTSPNAPVSVARLTNVTVTNTALGQPVPFVFLAQDGNDGLFSASVQAGSPRSDIVIFYECLQDVCAPQALVPTLSFRAQEAAGLPVVFAGRLPAGGDVFAAETVKAIQDGDTYRFEARFAVAGEAGPSASPVRLLPAAPNPVRTRTTLRFALPESGPVRLRLFDALGREIAVLANGDYGPGEHTVGVDATRLVPGVYLARLDAAGTSATQRFVVVR